MSEVAHNAQHEFWRPPAIPPEAAAPAMVEVCDGCETEFMVGAQFCHVCGAARPTQTNNLVAKRGWTRYLEFFKFLEFRNVKQWVGLSTPSLIAFFVGVGCLLAALAVGWFYTSHNFSDFQAIQLWRMQWLLAAVAAFVAAILLKRTGPQTK